MRRKKKETAFLKTLSDSRTFFLCGLSFSMPDVYGKSERSNDAYKKILFCISPFVIFYKSHDVYSHDGKVSHHHTTTEPKEHFCWGRLMPLLYNGLLTIPASLFHQTQNTGRAELFAAWRSEPCAVQLVGNRTER